MLPAGQWGHNLCQGNCDISVSGTFLPAPGRTRGLPGPTSLLPSAQPAGGCRRTQQPKLTQSFHVTTVAHSQSPQPATVSHLSLTDRQTRHSLGERIPKGGKKKTDPTGQRRGTREVNGASKWPENRAVTTLVSLR